MASTVIGEALETPAPVARGVLLQGAAANTVDAHETVELFHVVRHDGEARWIWIPTGLIPTHRARVGAERATCRRAASTHS